MSIEPAAALIPVAYTIDDAAKVAGVSRSTLYRALNSGELTARYRTRRPSILRVDLEAWIASAPTTPPSLEPTQGALDVA